MLAKTKGLISFFVGGAWWLADRLWGDQIFAAIKPIIPDVLSNPPVAEILQLAWTYAPPLALAGIGSYFFIKAHREGARRPPTEIENNGHISKTNEVTVDEETKRLAGLANAILEEALQYGFKLPRPSDDPFLSRYAELKSSAHHVWATPETNRLRREFLHQCGIVGSDHEYNLGANEMERHRIQLQQAGNNLIATLLGRSGSSSDDNARAAIAAHEAARKLPIIDEAIDLLNHRAEFEQPIDDANRMVHPIVSELRAGRRDEFLEKLENLKRRIIANDQKVNALYLRAENIHDDLAAILVQPYQHALRDGFYALTTGIRKLDDPSGNNIEYWLSGSLEKFKEGINAIGSWRTTTLAKLFKLRRTLVK